MSGKGNGTISVTVSELPAGTNLREGKISFTLIHPEFGKWGQAESSVAVKQYGSGVTPPPTGDAIYANDFDKEQAQKGADGKFPFADAFEGWKNQTGTGADNVAYKTSGISGSVRIRLRTIAIRSTRTTLPVSTICFSERAVFLRFRKSHLNLPRRTFNLRSVHTVVFLKIRTMPSRLRSSMYI